MRGFLFAIVVSSAILQQVVAATRGEYVVHGTLGDSSALGSAFLARDVAGGHSVVLVVPPDAESLDVVGALSDVIPADAGGCAACGFRIASWIDACPRCEHVLVPPPEPSPDATALRAELRHTMQVLGGLPHVRGGTMYFGHDASDGRLTAFVVRPQADGQLAMDVIWEAVPDTTAAASTTMLVPAAGRDPEREPAVDAGAYAVAHSPPYAPPHVPPHTPGEYRPEPIFADGSTEAGLPADAVPAQVAWAPEPPRARRWLPIGVGLGALVAVGAVAFALTRQGAPDAGTIGRDTGRLAVVDSAPALGGSGSGVGTGAGGFGTTAGTPGGDAIATGAAGGGTSVPPIPNDSVRVRRERRRRLQDSLRAVRASDQAVLTVEGDLPSGWSITVNGGPSIGSRDVPLVVGQPATIRLDAPGYCTDTLTVMPAPHGRKRWAPLLRGRPTVGEC